MTEQQAIFQEAQDAATLFPQKREVEIDFILRKLWMRKWWVVGVVFLTTLLSMLTLLIVKDIYELKASFRPALDHQFSQVTETGILQLDSEIAFKRLLQNLESRAVRRELFSQTNIRAGFVDGDVDLTEEQLFLDFDRLLSLQTSSSDEAADPASVFSQVTFRHSSPEYGVKVVNGLLSIASRYSVQDLEKEFESKRNFKISFLEQKVKNKVLRSKKERMGKIEELTEKNNLEIKNIQDQIDVEIDKIKSKRLDRIDKLKEALSIAEKLDIYEPASLNSFSQNSIDAQMEINTQISSREEPLYFLGSKVLRAELDVLINRQKEDLSESPIRELQADLELLKRHREVEILRERKNDLAFVSFQIKPLIDELDTIKNLQVDFDEISFARIDQPATIPHSSIEPNKRLVISMGVFIGLFIGLMFAYLFPSKERVNV